MKAKVVIFALMGIVLMAFGTFRINSKNQDQELKALQESPDRGTLNWHARVAKAQGKNQVQLRAPIIDYPGPDSNIDRILSYYSAIVAEPIFKRSYADDGQRQIVTWYKFKVVETLSREDIASCATCAGNSVKPPEDLLPLSKDEFVVMQYGGTETIDTVQITTVDPEFPAFALSEPYLLFVRLNTSGVAAIGVGPEAVFAVDASGVLRSVNRRPNRVKKEMETRFNLSLDALRTGVKSRPYPQEELHN
ncbi:MAG: hypothetical protein V7641_4131 [Blastocatellia bacterium]